jgi:hypothetical protein
MPGRDGLDIMLSDDLAEWLNRNDPDADDEPRELIVEARTPPRHVKVDARRSGVLVPREVEPTGPVDRARVTSELQRELTRLLGSPTTVLRAAGAVVVRARRDQLREILKLPLVKAVRPNRSLKRSG